MHRISMNRCSAPCVGRISKNILLMSIMLLSFSLVIPKNNYDLIKKWIFTHKKRIMKGLLYIEIKFSPLETLEKQNVLTGFNDLDAYCKKK